MGVLAKKKKLCKKKKLRGKKSEKKSDSQDLHVDFRGKTTELWDLNGEFREKVRIARFEWRIQNCEIWMENSEKKVRISI